MRQVWAEFLKGIPDGRHGAEIYADERDLAESVARFLAAGFERGEPGVVVATPEHRRLFVSRLAEIGWDEERIGPHLLIAVDAEETLASIMDGDQPSHSAFETVVGGLLERAEAHGPGGSPRAFGEMVDLLCADGNEDAAFELEGLWNDLASRRRFRLLCGYRLDLFDLSCQSTTLPRVCREHSHVMPARNYPRFARAVDRALRDTVGSTEAANVYLRVSRQAGTDERIPLAQLILMWVSENMPVRAQQILATAREHYTAAAVL
jgi:hypothetical protein